MRCALLRAPDDPGAGQADGGASDRQHSDVLAANDAYAQTFRLGGLGGRAAKGLAVMLPVQPSAALSAVVGSKPIPRTEVTKKLWAYIKKNGLQDKKKRTMINADDAMRAVFNGKSQVSMFEMTKLVSGHIR